MPEQSRQMKQETSLFPGALGLIRIFGVPVRLHFTFILLFVFLLFVGIGRRQSGLVTVVYIAALFGSVLLHEIGHALVAKRFGIRTMEIVMFPIGGVARLERSPKAREELWIAIAGPAVNMLIAAALFGYLASSGGFVPLTQLEEPDDLNLMQRIALGNLILAVFNLLPAFPMDGGRILRSLLARIQPETDATRTAARTGQFLAMLMGLYGLLMMNFLLIFVAFFVYLGAAQESAAAAGVSLTQGIPVRAAMVTDFRTLSHGDSIRDAANLLLSTTQQDFPVMHGGQVLGLLGRSALMRAMASGGPDSYVAGAMNRDFNRLNPNMDLAEALSTVLQTGSCALVMEGEELVGLLTAENLSEYLLLRRFGMPPLERTEVSRQPV